MTPEVSLELSYAFLTSFIACSLYSDLLFIVQSLSRVQLFATPRTLAHQRFFCPRGFSGKNTEMSFPFFLQGIFLSQGLNLPLLLGRQILYHWATWEAQQLK